MILHLLTADIMKHMGNGFDWIAVLPVIYTLSGALGGWLLSEVSQVIRLRRDERRAIGRALTDLMLIRRHITAAKEVAKMFSQHTTFTPQEQLQAQIVANNFLPDMENLRNRYEESVKVVSGIRPILGFSLNQQDYLLPMIERLRLFAAQDEQSSAAWPALEPHLSDTSALDSIITELAWLHSIKTWYDVRHHLKEPLGPLPPDVENLFKNQPPKKP
jgi:hypothetical protein